MTDVILIVAGLIAVVLAWIMGRNHSDMEHMKRRINELTDWLDLVTEQKGESEAAVVEIKPEVETTEAKPINYNTPDPYHAPTGPPLIPADLSNLSEAEIFELMNKVAEWQAIDPTDLVYPDDEPHEGAVILGPDEEPPFMFTEPEERDAARDRGWDEDMAVETEAQDMYGGPA